MPLTPEAKHLLSTSLSALPTRMRLLEKLQAPSGLAFRLSIKPLITALSRLQPGKEALEWAL